MGDGVADHLDADVLDDRGSSGAAAARALACAAAPAGAASVRTSCVSVPQHVDQRMTARRGRWRARTPERRLPRLLPGRSQARALAAVGACGITSAGSTWVSRCVSCSPLLGSADAQRRDALLHRVDLAPDDSAAHRAARPAAGSRCRVRVRALTQRCERILDRVDALHEAAQRQRRGFAFDGVQLAKHAVELLVQILLLDARGSSASHCSCAAPRRPCQEAAAGAAGRRAAAAAAAWPASRSRPSPCSSSRASSTRSVTSATTPRM